MVDLVIHNHVDATPLKPGKNLGRFRTLEQHAHHRRHEHHDDEYLTEYHRAGNPHDPGSSEAAAWHDGYRMGHEHGSDDRTMGISGLRHHTHHDDVHHHGGAHTHHHHHDDLDPVVWEEEEVDDGHRGPHGLHTDRRTTDRPSAGLNSTLGGLNAFLKGYYRKPWSR
jgi:hypothetical protein